MVTRTSTTMVMLLVLAAASVAPTGCRKAADVSQDAQASAAFRSAWEKRQSGDEAGYRAALADVVSRYPGSRAAARAQARQKADGGGNALAGMALAGVAAAVALPAAMRYRERMQEGHSDASPTPEGEVSAPGSSKRRAKKRR